MFQSTYLYKVRQHQQRLNDFDRGFNPRTYIRYDIKITLNEVQQHEFQSTYLYKVRPYLNSIAADQKFQSTYLYKVRHDGEGINVDFTQVSIHVPI